MTTSSTTNVFVPAGSYLLTSSDISVTISASCAQSNGNLVNSTVTFNMDEANSLYDISNLEGQLTLTSAAYNAGAPQDYNQYVPAGSYQLSSNNITITLNATCQDGGGSWVQSNPLVFTAESALQIEDISNNNGHLFITNN